MTKNSARQGSHNCDLRPHRDSARRAIRHWRTTLDTFVGSTTTVLVRHWQAAWRLVRKAVPVLATVPQEGPHALPERPVLLLDGFAGLVVICDILLGVVA